MGMDGSSKIIAVWYNANPQDEKKVPEFKPIAQFFGIWHEAMRGAHRGLHEMSWGNTHVLLINVHAGVYTPKLKAGERLPPMKVQHQGYKHLKPRDAVLIPTSAFKFPAMPPRRIRNNLRVGLSKLEEGQ